MIKIYTVAENRPDFIDLQMRMLKKNLQEGFEFIVFNNAALAVNGPWYREINTTSAQCGAKVIDVTRDTELEAKYQVLEPTGPIFTRTGLYASPNVGCAYPFCWAWDKVVSKEKGSIFWSHSDVFLTRPIALSELLTRHPLWFIQQGRGEHIRYMWEAAVLADLSQLPEPATMNWWCGKVDGVPVDVGGQTHFYLRAHPEIAVGTFGTRLFDDDTTVSFSPPSYERFYVGQEPTFLHYRSGSNWNGRSNEYHTKKTEWLHRQLGV
jgi:hypothetical protein